MRPAILVLLLAVGCWLEAAAQDASTWYQVQGGAWDVPAEVANAAATHLQEAAQLAPGPAKLRVRSLATYTVQYQGHLVDGKRLVRLAGACAAPGRTPDDLVRQWMVVFDGGDCFFDAEFDPVLTRFVSFSFHGYA